MSDTLPGYPPTSSEERYAIGHNIEQDCKTVTPELLPYIGTVYVAHDMDYVRKALGHSSLSYLGDSYGTALGSTYAALFPERVHRMVLDGVLDLANYYSANQNPELDIGDVDKALDSFFSSCHQAGKKRCPLWSDSVEKIKERFYEADQRIFRKPIPVPGYGLLKWPIWRAGVYTALYQPARGFPILAAGLLEILTGKAGPALTAYLQIVESAETSSNDWLVDSKTGLRNSPNAGTFIECSDSGALSGQLSTNQFDGIFNRYESVSRYFGGISSQQVIICDGAKMPSKARLRYPPKNITTATPVLFVANVADPTTPIINAHRMSEVFTGSRVLTINGTGHLSYNAENGTGCAKKWIAPYFR
jgi:pimeloyl-ACP methyl ester carboxylesterase